MGLRGSVGFDRELVEMDDGVRLRTWAAGQLPDGSTPLVLVHGDPGLPDYLEPVHLAVPDGWRAHRYDQRGTGGSPWTGQHTMERHVSDLKLLLDAWGYDRAILVGHSFGTDLASFFLLAHPDRVAGVIFLCGPFLGPWREVTHATERSRRSDQEQARLEQLAAVGRRSDPEEIEFLTLSWQTDHADGQGARAWAHDAARTRRPVNYAMNRQLNRDKRRQPLESQVDRLKAVLPPGSAIIGGDGDPRPAASLRHLADRLGCDVTIILGAGHEPWLEQPAAFTTVLRSAIHGCAARLRAQHQRGCPSDGGDR